jgi:hypothetical protein
MLGSHLQLHARDIVTRRCNVLPSFQVPSWAEGALKIGHIMVVCVQARVVVVVAPLMAIFNHQGAQNARNLARLVRIPRR